MEKYDPEFARKIVEHYPAGTQVEKALYLAQMFGKRTEFEAALKDHGRGVGFRRNGKSLIDLLNDVCVQKAELVKHDRTPRVYSVNNNFLAVENIQCVDDDGKVFEQYNHLAFSKDIFRKGGKIINFTPYNAAVHCEKNELFLPSFALTCNIVVALSQNRDNADANALLQQYKNQGGGHGYHAQNTIINYAMEEIIHYPTAADFNQTVVVNAGLRKMGKCTKASLQDDLLERALKDTAHTLYVKQLTGLANPFDLVEVGKYLDKPVRLWFPWGGQGGTAFNEKWAAWLGCVGDYFYLSGDGILSNYGAARGVKLVAP
ncbi:MAG: hypothetical protein Q7S55_05150 [Nanoarchaeota archaeon]|nr:hypothetical protein [Nanoarchaeota archaeon]